jgi:hypothetical protein
MAQVTRDLMKVIRADIDAALVAVAQKHGIAISLGNGSYSPDGLSGHFKLKLAAKTNADDGANANQLQARVNWDRHCEMFGLKKDWLNCTFIREGHEYKIIGLLPGRSKFPVLALKDGSKEVILPAAAVAERLNKVGA